MKILIAEDDFVSRKLMHKFLMPYGECKIAGDGQIALDIFSLSLEKEDYFSLVCLDIMMPEIDGLDVLIEMRNMEKAKDIDDSDKTKIIMTTALSDKVNVINAARSQCDGYLVKPIDKKKLINQLITLGLA
ncbi:response regulator [Candidatus Latescibacterota bacterium]